MRIKAIKKYIYLVILMLFCFSCTKEERSSAIKNELAKNDSQIEVTTSNEEIKPKYIINRRSGKIHSYSHGMNCGMSEHNKLESNENIEEILKNENYDICLTCFAGFKLNLDKYKTNKIVNDDDVDLTNREVNLIKLYMNMYEFGQLDTETQKFLICIFEVGSWYVHNVYTQLGGQKTAREVDDIAEVSASEGAYNKWRNYLKEYGDKYEFKENKKILSTLYDYDRKKYSGMAAYRCDLFKDAGYGKGNTEDTKMHMQTLKNPEGEEIFQEYKNYCVIDDSSKFAAAVFYHYINKEILKEEELKNRDGYGIDLWDISSEDFLTNTRSAKKLTTKKLFKYVTWDMLKKKKENDRIELYYNNKKFELQIGDLICRKGHVDFYLGNNKVINWGSVHKTYTLNKGFTIQLKGFKSNYNEDKDIPFETIIRLRR